VTQTDRTQQRLIETYRKKAKHYDVTSRLYPAPGYPQRAQRLRAVQALGLRAGASVIDIACGTGLNFPLIEEAIGPGGRIVGVDLTDAMLAQAQDRIETNGWSNISLVQADAAWMAQLGTAIVRPFAGIDEWITRRPWEAIRAAMREELADLSWTELFFGTAFLAAGSRSPQTLGGRPRGISHQ
jgi:demethylmenaquinone methyltransferase/2-methoxy-6-polyprenyl-1,4-benzoquinol methylase